MLKPKTPEPMMRIEEGGEKRVDVDEEEGKVEEVEFGFRCDIFKGWVRSVIQCNVTLSSDAV